MRKANQAPANPLTEKAPSKNTMVAFPCSRDEKEEMESMARRYNLPLGKYLMALHAKQLRTASPKSEEVA